MRTDEWARMVAILAREAAHTLDDETEAGFDDQERHAAETIFRDHLDRAIAELRDGGLL